MKEDFSKEAIVERLREQFRQEAPEVNIDEGLIAGILDDTAEVLAAMARGARALAIQEWMKRIRARLVDDDDSIADVDLLYGLYVAATGENDLPHPYDTG
jgi:hypothetical protein